MIPDEDVVCMRIDSLNNKNDTESGKIKAPKDSPINFKHKKKFNNREFNVSSKDAIKINRINS